MSSMSSHLQDSFTRQVSNMSDMTARQISNNSDMTARQLLNISDTTARQISDLSKNISKMSDKIQQLEIKTTTISRDLVHQVQTIETNDKYSTDRRETVQRSPDRLGGVDFEPRCPGQTPLPPLAMQTAFRSTGHYSS